MFCKHIFLKSEECKGVLSYIRVGMALGHFTFLPWLAVQWSIEYLKEMTKLYHTHQFMQKVKSKDTSRMKLQNFE
jgi:hypothetical protein